MKTLQTVAVLAIALAAACGKGDHAPDAHAGGPPGGGEMKMPVTVLTLHDEPIEEGAEYLAQLVSRHQVALYPQVVGNVSAIFVKPGDRVKQGTALLQIDPRKESANLANQIAARAQKEASLDLAKRNEARSASLMKEGLASRQQFDQDRGLREVAEQELKSQGAVIQAQQAQLTYYRIAAPFDGTVGDIPVKLGDFVSAQTKLTSLDDNTNLEAYVNVPADKIRLLGDQSHVQLIDGDRSVLADAKVSFVAEEANPLTQSVLVKATFPNEKRLRAAQVVRARVIWGAHPGVRVPTASVFRQTGQYFVYVAEGAPAKARQAAITVGEIDDSRYAVLTGLKAGDKVITSQIQKLHEGALVDPSEQPASASADH
jgi:RND family efflux transporter MFP subunit